jgi:hypothetical protein
MDSPPDRPSAGWQQKWEKVATRAIRGPLARIVGGLEALHKDKAVVQSDHPRKIIESSLVACARLAEMLEGLVDVQEAAGKPPGTWLKSVSVTMSLAAEVHALEARAKVEGKTFTWRAEEMGLAVAADEDLLRRAFRLAGDRILDDAPAGTSVHALASGGGGTVRLRITAPPAGADAPPGGIAESVELAFVHMAIEFMGGESGTVSTADMGMSVDMVLPAAGAAPVPSSPAAAPTPIDDALAMASDEAAAWESAAPPPGPREKPEPQSKLVHAPPPPPQEQPQAKTSGAKGGPEAEAPADDEAAGHIKIIRTPTYKLDD